MRIRTYLAVMVCLMLAMPAWAKGISESEARQIASSFMSSHFMTGISASPRLAHRAPAVKGGATAPYYVFNAGRAGDGYVIVAGDDRVPQVLGYSDEGYFDYDNVPEAMQAWLDSYAAQVAALDEGAVMASHLKTAQPIAPLVKANWSQNPPYNILLPYRPNGTHALVGCVATAAAQVMYYWRWPKQPTKAIPGYVSKTLEYNMPALEPVTFNWDLMRDNYLISDTVEPSPQAVATLCKYCAQAVQMDFKEKTSSASSIDLCDVMPQYFDYAPEAQFMYRTYYSTEQWENMILNELKARRPVIYSASQLSGGHAFICDGYDGNGMFHINWGWNGSDNGYFLLNILNPDQNDPSSADESHGYVLRQAVIVGLHPNTSTEMGLIIHDRGIKIENTVNTRTSMDQDFKVIQETQFMNGTTRTVGFNYAWGLYHDNQLLKVMQSGVKDKLDSWYYTSISRTLSIGSGISSGTFRILPLYSELNTTNWKPCPGSDVNFIEVTINGNNCTFTCYSNALTPDYKINSIDVKGNMHPNRPVDLTLNMTNNGYTSNDIIYMFAEDKVVSVGLADFPHAQTRDFNMCYVPEKEGKVNLKFALDEDGKQVLAEKVVSIDPMPAANLTGSINVLNVTDAANKIITAKDFSGTVSIRNAGTTTYDEDIVFTLYKATYDGHGSGVQSITQHLTLEPRQSKTLTFHLDNVIDGWQYFAYAFYYSEGERKSIKGTASYTIVLPSAVIKGDINSDGMVNISDINALINMILKGDQATIGDVNGDGVVNIADVNATISIILNGH